DENEGLAAGLRGDELAGERLLELAGPGETGPARHARRRKHRGRRGLDAAEDVAAEARRRRPADDIGGGAGVAGKERLLEARVGGGLGAERETLAILGDGVDVARRGRRRVEEVGGVPHRRAALIVDAEETTAVVGLALGARVDQALGGHRAGA